VVSTATKAFENFDHTKALETTETFFWTFTDDYLELVKERAYANAGQVDQVVGSAVIALREALSVLVRLFAPFVPFAAEEVWSWWQEGSVHLSPWPQEEEIAFTETGLMDLASKALVLIRKTKSDAKLSMKAEIATLTLTGDKQLEFLRDDLMAVGKIHNLILIEGDELAISHLEFAAQE
jgi:valyl-tRNA synthetase